MVSLTPHDAMFDVYPRKMVQLVLRVYRGEKGSLASPLRSSALSSGRGS